MADDQKPTLRLELDGTTLRLHFVWPGEGASLTRRTVDGRDKNEKRVAELRLSNAPEGWAAAIPTKGTMSLGQLVAVLAATVVGPQPETAFLLTRHYEGLRFFERMKGPDSATDARRKAFNRRNADGDRGPAGRDALGALAPWRMGKTDGAVELRCRVLQPDKQLAQDIRAWLWTDSYPREWGAKAVAGLRERLSILDSLARGDGASARSWRLVVLSAAFRNPEAFPIEFWRATALADHAGDGLENSYLTRNLDFDAMGAALDKAVGTIHRAIRQQAEHRHGPRAADGADGACRICHRSVCVACQAPCGICSNVFCNMCDVWRPLATCASCKKRMCVECTRIEDHQQDHPVNPGPMRPGGFRSRLNESVDDAAIAQARKRAKELDALIERQGIHGRICKTCSEGRRVTSAVVRYADAENCEQYLRHCQEEDEALTDLSLLARHTDNIFDEQRLLDPRSWSAALPSPMTHYERMADDLDAAISRVDPEDEFGLSGHIWSALWNLQHGRLPDEDEEDPYGDDSRVVRYSEPHTGELAWACELLVDQERLDLVEVDKTRQPPVYALVPRARVG